MLDAEVAVVVVRHILVEDFAGAIEISRVDLVVLVQALYAAVARLPAEDSGCACPDDALQSLEPGSLEDIARPQDVDLDRPQWIRVGLGAQNIGEMRDALDAVQ